MVAKGRIVYCEYWQSKDGKRRKELNLASRNDRWVHEGSYMICALFGKH